MYNTCDCICHNYIDTDLLWETATLSITRSMPLEWMQLFHYDDVIMGTIASQITSLTMVYSTVYSGADQRKHQSSASLAFVRGIHRWAVNSQYNGPVTQKMFPFDDVIMYFLYIRCRIEKCLLLISKYSQVRVHLWWFENSQCNSKYICIYVKPTI